LEVVGDRYLLLHGGYDGCSLLGDTWVFETHSNRWLAVDVQGEPCQHSANILQLADGQYQLSNLDLHMRCTRHVVVSCKWVSSRPGRFLTWCVRFLVLAAPASEMPVPRALHTVASLGQRFVLLGGKGPLGELGDVSLLECPAVQQGRQLQHQQQASQAQLLRCQQRGAQVAADLACSRAQLQEAERQLQVMVLQDRCMYASASAPAITG
jgi:hypothetical protein